MEPIEINSPIPYLKSLEFSPSDIKQLENGASTIKGYASTFGNEDLMKDVMVKGCFAESIQEKQGMWPVLLNHESSQQIGMNVLAKETSKGLYTESQLYTDQEAIPKAKEALALIRKAKEIGCPMGLSIGGIVTKFVPEWQDDKGWIIKIMNFKVLEHSVTPIPANPKAVITQTKSLMTAVEKYTKEAEVSLKLEKNTKEAIDLLKEFRNSLKQAIT